MSENDNKSNEVRDILGKLLGVNNLPEDCVINAMLNDQRLEKLAEYDLSKGFTNFNYKTEELQAKFAEFKTAVLKKSSTLAELETAVFSRYGILEKPRINSSIKEKMISEINDVQFADKKPIMGFASERNEVDGKKNTTKSTKEKRG